MARKRETEGKLILQIIEDGGNGLSLAEWLAGIVIVAVLTKAMGVW